jgi:ABC-2 type transport system ATP-binding protein
MSIPQATPSHLARAGSKNRDPAPAVEAAGLTKRFHQTTAVDGLDLKVPAGGVYGLLGPNGAGKTTAIRIFATLLRPDAGAARVLGHDVEREAEAVRSRISLTGQFASVDDDLSGRENLVLLARLLGYSRPDARTRASELLDTFGLGEASERLVKSYSGGMRRRLDIAASIIATPDLLFLDEPTTGLDPVSRNAVWEIVRALVARGTTVLLTTQYLDEADHLADRIAVMKNGTVIAEGTSSELKASVGSGTLRLRLQDTARRAAADRVLSELLGVAPRLAGDPAELNARISDPARVGDLLAELSRREIEVAELALGQPSLDEVFLTLTADDTTTTRRKPHDAPHAYNDSAAIRSSCCSPGGPSPRAAAVRWWSAMATSGPFATASSDP